MILPQIFPPNVGRLKTNKNVRALVKACSHRDTAIRRQASEALSDLRDPASVEPLIGLLSHKDSHVRGTAAWVLGEIGDARAVEPLLAILRESDVCNAVGRALGKIKDVRAVEPLAAVLSRHPEHWGYITPGVAVGLGMLGDRRALGYLVSVVEDGYDWDVTEAVQVLSQFGETAADRLRPLLAYGTPPKTDSGTELGNWYDHRARCRERALMAMRLIGEAAIDSLIKGLADGHVSTPNDWTLGPEQDRSTYYCSAADLLVEIGSRAVPALIRALDGDKRVMQWVARVLGEIGDRRAEAPLNQALQKYGCEDIPFAIEAAHALNTLSGESIRSDSQESRKGNRKRLPH